MFGSYGSSFSKTPETDKVNHKKWIDTLKSKGFEFGTKEIDSLLLTDNNIKLLENAILEVLPTAKFTSLRNWCYKENIIKDIHFGVSLEDLIYATR